MIPLLFCNYRYQLQQSFLIFHKYFTFCWRCANKSEDVRSKSEVQDFSFNFRVEATKIATISPASINKGLNLAGSTVLDSINISNQYKNKSELESRKSEVKNQYLLPTSDFRLPTWSAASLASLRAISILLKKSLSDCADLDSRTFAPTEVADRSNCLLSVLATPGRSSKKLQAFTTLIANDFVLSVIGMLFAMLKFNTNVSILTHLFELPTSDFRLPTCIAAA